MKLEDKLSDAALRMKRSIVREMLKLTKNESIISFSPGMPDPSVFPAKELSEVTQRVLEREGEIALQYSPTEGNDRLKETLIEFLAEDGVQTTSDNILVITASQQGLDLSTKVFINPGDHIVCELPTFLAAIGAFFTYGAELVGVPLDDDGMTTSILRERLGRLRKSPKIIYVIPDFQNPAGVTMSLSRRHEVLDLAEEYDVLVLEDSPYRSLRYKGENIPSFQELDRSGRVITIYTFSKILSPGLRLGWIVASPEVVSRLVTAKQSTDACTPAFTQCIVNEFCRRNLLSKHIEKLKVIYKEKMNAMLQALEDYMPDKVRWTRPEGGLFLWVTLPANIDASSMLPDAIREESVAYTPGAAFFPDGAGHNTMRLNFSYPSISQIRSGVERLARMIRKKLS